MRASEIKAFADCRARWFARYVLNYGEPETASQKRGTAVHKYIENTLRGKDNNDATEEVRALAEAILEYLPENDGSLEIEPPFTETILEVPCTGTPDLLQAATASLWDHKTTSGQQYTKTIDELREDPQAIMYAAYLVFVRKWSHVSMTWNYVLTRGFPDVITTSWCMYPTEISKAFDKLIRQPYEDMKELRKQHKQGLLQIIADVPGNTASCAKYGGCPHRKYCAHASTVIEDNKMAKPLAQRAAERRAQQAQPPEAQPQSILPPDAPAETTPTEEDKKPRRRVASQGQLPVARVGQTLADKIGAAAAPPPEQGTDFDVPPPEAPPPPVRRRAPQKPAEAPPAHEQAPAAPTTPPAHEPAAPTPPPAAPTPEPAPAPTTISKPVTPAPKGTKTVPAARIALLCIGCAPVQGEIPVYGSGIIEEAARVVEQEQNISHYSLLSYGTGPALVGQKVQQLLSTRQYGCVVLDARLDGRIIDAFASMAASIIRGFGTL